MKLSKLQCQTMVENEYCGKNSKEDELAFQLISEETICNTKAFKTTTDFYVIFDDQLNENTFGITSEKMTFNKQHDINNLILAEEDKRYYDYWETKREIEDEEAYLKCKIITNQIKRTILDHGNFNILSDINSNEITTYTFNKIIYIPMCTKVTEIRMDRNEKKCFKDLPILFKPKNYGELEFHFQKGFLTYNNIIKNESIEINCVNINENIILP